MSRLQVLQEERKFWPSAQLLKGAMERVLASMELHQLRALIIFHANGTN